jgi:hypothetical protein
VNIASLLAHYWPLLVVSFGISGISGFPETTADLFDVLPGLRWLFAIGGLALIPFTSGLAPMQLVVLPLGAIAIACAVIWRRRPRNKGT